MRTLSALALLLSAQAFACPDLTGTYTCQAKNSNQTLTVTQLEDKSGVTVYKMNDTSLPADNVAYSIPDDQNLKGGTFRTWCDPNNANLLQTEILGKYWSQGSYYADLLLDTTYSLSGRDLKMTTSGNLKNSGGTYPLTSEITCTRNL